MFLGRFRSKTQEDFFGFIEGDQVIRVNSKERYPLSELKILPPTVATKIIGIGLNYRDHAKELGMEIPKEPLFFFKPPSAVIAHLEEIVLPIQSREVHYEGELAIVIGKRIHKPKNINEIKEAILGYTCFNDVTARDLQKKDIQWTRSKSFDTFAPVGPFIRVDIKEPGHWKIETLVNGEVKQSSYTSELIFHPFELVKFLANIMTLNPGDIIATGTPPGVGKLKDGDVVEVKIETIGSLINKVVSETGEKTWN